MPAMSGCASGLLCVRYRDWTLPHDGTVPQCAQFALDDGEGIDHHGRFGIEIDDVKQPRGDVGRIAPAVHDSRGG